MITNTLINCELCNKASCFATEACKGHYQFETTKFICITIGILVAVALVLYFVRDIIKLCDASCKEKMQQRLERRDKERQTLIDYRSKYLSFLKDNNKNDLYKTTITNIIDEHKSKLESYDQKKK